MFQTCPAEMVKQGVFDQLVEEYLGANHEIRMCILSSLLDTTKELLKNEDTRESLSSFMLTRIMSLMTSIPESTYDLAIGWTNTILYDSLTRPSDSDLPDSQNSLKYVTRLDSRGFHSLIFHLAHYMDTQVNLGAHDGAHYFSEEQVKNLTVTLKLLLVLNSAHANQPSLMTQLESDRESQESLKKALHSLIKWYMLNHIKVPA